MGKCAVRRTPLWLRLQFYIIQGFTNALWKIIFNAKCGINFFLLSSIIPHWWKPLWMLRAFVNCTVVLKKRLNIFFFQWPKVDQVRNEYLSSYLNWWHNWQLKNRRRSHTLKGSHSMGDGRIFLPRRFLLCIKIYRMSLVSTGSISLVSTFNDIKTRLFSSSVVPFMLQKYESKYTTVFLLQ